MPLKLLRNEVTKYAVTRCQHLMVKRQPLVASLSSFIVCRLEADSVLRLRLERNAQLE
jgi:hypothetical protein